MAVVKMQKNGQLSDLTVNAELPQNHSVIGNVATNKKVYCL